MVGVRINVEGRGRSLDDAKTDLYACLQGEAEERGLPVTASTPAQSYRVSVRPEHAKYVCGRSNEDLGQALKDACQKAGIEAVDPKAHYLRIEASYELRKGDTPAPTHSPSGAAPSEQRARRDIADNLF